MVPLVMSGVVMVLSIFNSIKAGYYSGFSQVGLVGSYLVITLLLIYLMQFEFFGGLILLTIITLLYQDVRSLKTIAIQSIIFTITIYVTFGLFLKIPFPTLFKAGGIL